MKNVSMTWFNSKEHMPIKGNRVFILYQDYYGYHIETAFLYGGDGPDMRAFSKKDLDEGIFCLDKAFVKKEHVLSWAYVPDANELLKELSND